MATRPFQFTGLEDRNTPKSELLPPNPSAVVTLAKIGCCVMLTAVVMLSMLCWGSTSEAVVSGSINLADRRGV